MAGLAFPKPRPRDLDRQALAKLRDKIDRQERAKVMARSGGRCEVRVTVMVVEPFDLRCTGRSTEVHHLIGGIGRRNKGRSILAEHRLATCQSCHTAITRHVLQPVGEGREDAATVRYERAR